MFPLLALGLLRPNVSLLEKIRLGLLPFAPVTFVTEPKVAPSCEVMKYIPPVLKLPSVSCCEVRLTLEPDELMASDGSDSGVKFWSIIRNVMRSVPAKML